MRDEIFDCFSDTLGLARARFLAACDMAGIRVSAFPGQATGSENDSKPAFADIALFGSPAAKTVLILAPSEGGRSSFLASGVMTAAIRQQLYTRLPRDVSLLMIHAVNPKGPLWEGGDVPAPATQTADAQPTEPETSDAQQWDDDMLARAEARFLLDKGQSAVSSGFSRQELENRPLSDLIVPAWDNRVIDAIVENKLSECEAVFVLEIGTAPGPAGTVELFGQDAPFWQELTENAPSPAEAGHVGLYDILSQHTLSASVSGAVARFGYEAEAGKAKALSFLLDTTDRSWQPATWKKASAIIEHAIEKASGPQPQSS